MEIDDTSTTISNTTFASAIQSIFLFNFIFFK